MYKLYFDEGYSIVSIVVRASNIKDALYKVSLIIGEKDAFTKVHEIHSLNQF